MKAAQKVSIRGISSRTAMPCLDILKNTVDQAIGELEIDITEEKTNSPKHQNPLELKPNFYGLGIDLKKIRPWFYHMKNKWFKNK